MTEQGRRYDIHEIMRWTGISSRSYVYDLAQQLGYQRINGVFVNTESQERQGDIMFQMVSEMHDRIVRNEDKYDDKGRLKVALPKPFHIDGGYMYIPVDPTPMTDKDVATWVKLGSNIATSTKPEGLKELMSWAVSRIMYRVNELEK
jgi:hypothetical protein